LGAKELLEAIKPALRSKITFLWSSSSSSVAINLLYLSLARLPLTMGDLGLFASYFELSTTDFKVG